MSFTLPFAEAVKVNPKFWKDKPELTKGNSGEEPSPAKFRWCIYRESMAVFSWFILWTLQRRAGTQESIQRRLSRERSFVKLFNSRFCDQTRKSCDYAQTRDRQVLFSFNSFVEQLRSKGL